jgi:hypothetical protein
MKVAVSGGRDFMRARLVQLAASVMVIWVMLFGSVIPSYSADQTPLEKQLMKRVDEFYQTFLTGNWTRISQYITKDSQDIWLAQPKGLIESYKIDSVTVAPDGKTAKVMVKVMTRFMQTAQLLTQLQNSDWIYEKGQWLAKLHPQDPTPMTEMIKSGAASMPNSPGMANQPKAHSPLLFDETEVHIRPSSTGGDVVVKIPYQNTTPFLITIDGVGTTCNCLKVEMDKMMVESAVKGTLIVTYHGSGAPPSGPQKIHATFLPLKYEWSIPVVFDSK